MSCLVTPQASSAIRKRHGEYGAAWLDRIDARIYGTASRLGVSVLTPLPGGTMGVVAVGTAASGDRLVFKANPDHAAAEREAAALRRLTPFAPEIVREFRDGLFVMRYVDAPAESGACGNNATARVLPVLKVIGETKAVGEVFDPSVVLQKIYERLGAYDSLLLDAVDVDGLRRRLEASMQTDPLVWCHGDLNSSNTLSPRNGDPFVVIDPIPVVAPVAYDAGYWATCPHRGVAGLDERLSQLDATLPSSDLYAWAVLGAALHLTYHTHYRVAVESIKPSRETLQRLLAV